MSFLISPFITHLVSKKEATLPYSPYPLIPLLIKQVCSHERLLAIQAKCAYQLHMARLTPNGKQQYFLDH